LTSEPRRFGKKGNIPRADSKKMIEELLAVVGKQEEKETILSEAIEDGAITAQELAWALGIKRNTVVLKLRPFIHEGIVGCKTVSRPDITGKIVKVPGYFLIKEE
jgi:transcription initiation factor IIE alpha subunit